MKKRYCLIGLGKIGYNLAISLNNKGFDFDFWDIDKSKTRKLSDKIKKKPIKSLINYINEKNKTIFLLLIPHYKINNFIKSNIKYLKKKDIIIDFGNSNPNQTHKIHTNLVKMGILFFGIGFSGGIEGAANTPCLMISGKKKDIKKISYILKIILNDNSFNVLGEDPRLGHLCKICHNAIEYGLMKLLSEFYILQKNILKLSHSQIEKNFNKMNVKNPNFYLGDISSKIVKNKKHLLYKKNISDKIEHNKTSKWFNMLCLENDLVYPTLLNALENRILSKNTKNFNLKKKKLKNTNINIDYIDLFSSLYYICYIQGIVALLSICKIKKIKLNLNSLLKVWSKNCIISSHQIITISQISDIKKIKNLKILSKTKINTINSDLSNLINFYIINQENPSGLFSIFNWINSHNFLKKDENIFINILRNTFGNHKITKN